MNNQEKLAQFAEYLKQVDGLLIPQVQGWVWIQVALIFAVTKGLESISSPLKHLGKSFRDMATPQLFHTDPKLAWGFYMV